MHPAVIDRFWSYVAKTETCWLWTGSQTAKGKHGKFNVPVNGVSGRHQTTVVAHKFSFERENGSVPEGHDLHHVCENKLCVRPSHLMVLPHGSHSTLTNRNRIAKGTLNVRKGVKGFVGLKEYNPALRR